MKSVNLLDCKDLRACDAYFATKLCPGALIGDIELTAEQVAHLGKVISDELEKKPPSINQSPSVAIFLAWMGIFYYQDGNYWTPVLEALGLPQGQVKWQTQLGDVFLRVIAKYGLLNIDSANWLRYTTPILAHGYVPSYYLDSYFRDGLLTIYKNMVRDGQSINRDQVEAMVVNWRQDCQGYLQLRAEQDNLDKEELQLHLFQQALNHQDELVLCERLLREKVDSVDLSELLDLPDDWLITAEEEKRMLQQQNDQLCSLLEQAQGSLESAEFLAGELEDLNELIANVARSLFADWDSSNSDLVMKIPLAEAKELAGDYFSLVAPFKGILGRLLRLLMPKRYKQAVTAEHQLRGLFRPMQIRENILPGLVEGLAELQGLLARHHEMCNAHKEQESAWEEVAAESALLAKEADLGELQERLDAISKEIVSYKMRVVKLGQGKYETGEDFVAQQREIHRKMNSIRSSVSGDLHTLLACLPIIENYDKKSLQNSIIRVRKLQLQCSNKLKVYTNPMYSLIESTRALILEGGDRTISFVYNSLLKMQALDKRIDSQEIILPARIATAMEKWWHDYGQGLIEEVHSEQDDSGRETGGGIFRKPFVHLDTLDYDVKVQFPGQHIEGDLSEASFIVQGESGSRKETNINLRKTEGGYKTEQVEIVLGPEETYTFDFSYGGELRTWEAHGPGWDKFCMLFNNRRQLVEGFRLPDSEAWIIAPAEFSIEPAEVIREQAKLLGAWSGYVCIFADLEGVDVILVRSGQNIDILKRQSSLLPTLLGGDLAAGITTDTGLPVYVGGLPGLAFSVTHLEELRHYGVKLVYEEKDKYISLSDLKLVVSKDNAVYVELKDLLRDVYGLAQINLIYRGGKVIWSGKCAVVPDLQVGFNKDVYIPVVEEPEKGRMTISAQVPLSFSIDSPGIGIGASENKSLAEFPSFCTTLTGELFYPLQGFNIKVCIDVPCIRWRLKGAGGWNAVAKEIWHEDIGEIEVKVPSSIDGLVRLSLEEDRQVIPGPVKNGIATFNLCSFLDSLRTSRTDVLEVKLSVIDVSCVLFSIRTQWRVVNIGVNNWEEGDLRIVRLNWTDLGKASNRVLRLWPQDIPAATMSHFTVKDGASQLKIVAPLKSLPAGSYLLQFDVDNPWSNEEATRPEAGLMNCHEIVLGEIWDVSTFEWRLQGERVWRVIPSAIWHEDLGIMELLVPSGFSGNLRLKHTGQVQPSILANDNMLVFDLTQFYEAVLSSDSPSVIQIQCGTVRYDLFTIHSRWDVQDLVYHIYPDGDKWEFHIIWQEQCNATGRYLRVWPGDFQSFEDWVIPDGDDTKVIVRVPREKYPAGRYIIQFAQGESDKPNLEGRNELYADIPISTGQPGYRTRRSSKRGHKNPVLPEYKCPRHNLILPIGTNRCDICGYKVERHKTWSTSHLLVRR